MKTLEKERTLFIDDYKDHAIMHTRRTFDDGTTETVYSVGNKEFNSSKEAKAFIDGVPADTMEEKMDTTFINNMIEEVGENKMDKDEIVAKFRAGYAKAKTWAALDEVYRSLSIDDMKKLRDALQTMKDFTGLDIRQDFLLRCLVGYIDAKDREDAKHEIAMNTFEADLESQKIVAKIEAKKAAKIEAKKAAKIEGEKLTERSHELFVAYAEDADNWSGTPLVGGNVSEKPGDKGNLSDLVKKGLIEIATDEGCSWIYFTDKGKRLAEIMGIEIHD